MQFYRYLRTCYYSKNYNWLKVVSLNCKVFFILWIIIPAVLYAQTSIIDKNIEADNCIRKALFWQVEAWNKGDINDYMSVYWKSDSLKFIGSANISYGWNKTLQSYKESYPDKESMGHLSFSDIEIEVLSENSAFVIGKWKLVRDKGNLNGIFTLLFKKINDKWVIVCDHTS